MQIVSDGDNLHEMSNPVFWENKENVIDLPSAELAHNIGQILSLLTCNILFFNL